MENLLHLENRIVDNSTENSERISALQLYGTREDFQFFKDIRDSMLDVLDGDFDKDSDYSETSIKLSEDFALRFLPKLKSYIDHRIENYINQNNNML